MSIILKGENGLQTPMQNFYPQVYVEVLKIIL